MQMNIENITLDDIKERLTTTLFNLSAAFAIITLIASLSRISTLGFMPVMALHTVIVISMIVIVIFSKHIHYTYRGQFLCITLFIGGVAGLHNFGLSAGGTIFLYGCSIISAMILNFRAAIAFNVGGAAALILYLVLINKLGYTFKVDVGEYGLRTSSWLVYILSYVFINSVVLFLVIRVNQYLIKLSELQKANLTRTEVKLDYSQTILNTVLNNLPFAILWKDADSNYVGANKQFLAQMGLKNLSDIAGSKDSDFLPNDQVQKIQKMEQTLIGDREAKIRYHDIFEDEQGNRKHREVMRIGMHSDSGELVGLLVSFNDITEFKRLEEKAQKAMEQATAANTAKSRFLANISHELRTPMNGVYGLLDLCLQTEVTQQQADYLLKATTSIRLLTRIINDLLDLSKIEANQLQLEQIPFSFKELLVDVENLFRKDAEAKGLQLEIDYYGKDDLLPIGDPTRISQIIFNLLSNAIKFTDSGKVKVTIKSLEYSGILTTKIYVQDSGKGIADENLGKIFDAFTQAELATTRESGGSGLGLSIVKKLVEQMEGLMSVKSSVGVGTKFCITLRHKQQGKEKRVDRKKRNLIDLKGKSILVVDDNLINIEIAGAMLAQNGAEVHSAYNGVEAIEFLNKQTVDLVLLDIAMPVMDGCECIKRIRAMRSLRNLPVIALTANVMASEVETYRELGFDTYIPKPYERAHLLETIANYL
ncbi:ATP-binding protein [Alteromonas sp. W364]|uniref:ATP-binding protein n=1 Tax=Alteromonas sp. W364 TaxID=3075610 RepID=UPI002883AFE7|nr:ATP-binding protein [Alteromonas sp. W364]MDT0629452.1 ATP-binding protein [Alteromonas sp. W364]